MAKMNIIQIIVIEYIQKYISFVVIAQNKHTGT